MRHSNSMSPEKKWLKKHAHLGQPWLTLSSLLLCITGLLLIPQAYALATIIHALFSISSNTPMPSQLWPALIAFITLWVARTLLSTLSQSTAHQGAWRIQRQQRQQHLLWLEQGQLHSLPEASQFSQETLSAIQSLEGYYVRYLPQRLPALLLPLCIAGIIFHINWLLGVILFLTAPLLPLFMALIGVGAARLNQQQFLQLTRLGQQFLDAVRGLINLKWLGQDHAFETHIEKASTAYRCANIRVLRVAFLSSAVLEFFSALVIALVAILLGCGLLGYFQPGGSPVDFFHALWILILIPDFYAPLRALAASYHERAEALAASERLCHYPSHLKLPSTEKPSTVLKTSSPPALRIQNLSFAFEKEHPILQSFHLDLQPGESVALRGPSGIGKSTLLSLIQGFLTPQEGHIFINEHSITDCSQATWLSAFSTLGPHAPLMKGSLRSNLLLAKPDADDEQLQSACDAAYVSAFLSQLPQGLDTPLGEDGFGLSGGQAQRVALARCFLKRAPILLLDEPTLFLDHDSATKVQKALNALQTQCTVLLVTHDLNTMHACDRIVALETVT